MSKTFFSNDSNMMHNVDLMNRTPIDSIFYADEVNFKKIFCGWSVAIGDNNIKWFMSFYKPKKPPLSEGVSIEFRGGRNMKELLRRIGACLSDNDTPPWLYIVAIIIAVVSLVISLLK